MPSVAGNAVRSLFEAGGVQCRAGHVTLSLLPLRLLLLLLYCGLQSASGPGFSLSTLLSFQFHLLDPRHPLFLANIIQLSLELLQR
jgi:hypothetical protein